MGCGDLPARGGFPAVSAAAETLRDELLGLVRDSGLASGDRLPTEAQLAARFGVARSTMREALKRLEEEGLVDAVQGKGRFVSAFGALVVERPITRYEGIAEMLSNLGFTVTTAVLSFEEVTATPAQAKALEIADGSELIRLTRLRYGDDEPLVYTVDLIVRDALPGPLSHRDWSSPLTDALAAHGSEITSSVARISAVDLPEKVQAAHNLGGLGPWLLVTETCVTRTGRRILLAQDYHRGSAIGFNVRRRR
jgi:Transcriptional regulators